MKKISILGSTGSVGKQALEVVDALKDEFEIVSLVAGHNVSLLNEQIKKYKPKYAFAVDKNLIEGAIPLSLQEIASDKSNDIILIAISNQDALLPTVTALQNGINIALANKESIVMAGEILTKLAKDKGVNLLPVDSEHSAIHQCITNKSQIEKLILTASGGPFLYKSAAEMDNVSLSDALKHPRWKMGKKITIDSATLMNKALEIIEAHHFFNIDYDKIDVIIHPQSIIHSAVEYVDGSVIAQLGVPSMHLPIQYALTYPERCSGIKSKSFNFSDVAKLEFIKPDFNKFKALKLAYSVGKEGGAFPVYMNAINEEVVSSFLENKILFKNIIPFVEKILEQFSNVPLNDLKDVMQADYIARVKTKEFLKKI